MQDPELTLAAVALRRASPELWAKFVAAFESHANQRVNNLIRSPSDALSLNQGSARESTALLKLFKDCAKDADKLENIKWQGKAKPETWTLT